MNVFGSAGYNQPPTAVQKNDQNVQELGTNKFTSYVFGKDTGILSKEILAETPIGLYTGKISPFTSSDWEST